MGIQDEDLEASIMASMQNIAAVCLVTNYPTLASLPHSIINAYKDNVLALGIMLEESFPQVRAASSFHTAVSCYCPSQEPLFLAVKASIRLPLEMTSISRCIRKVGAVLCSEL